jgi:hypothetical protein
LLKIIKGICSHFSRIVGRTGSSEGEEEIKK